MSAFKLGKLPARPGAVKMSLRAYMDRGKLPAPPASFSYDLYMPDDCGMFANDVVGDCVWAGAAHETRLARRVATEGDNVVDVNFTDANVLADYSAVTGYDPNDPSTDRGTDMQVAASYRRKVGVIDAAGTRHQIAAYVALTPKNLEEALQACWLFGGIGIGITISDQQIDQFLADEPWSGPLTVGAGGHYVTLIGVDTDGMLQVMTFGRTVQLMSPDFFKANNDEGLAYLSLEMLNNGMSVRGLDLEALQADLALLTG